MRVAGNVIGPLELDSIEYSVIYLHSSVILILGHEDCGAVTAVIQNNTKDIEAVAKLIGPAVQEAKKSKANALLERAIKINAMRMKAVVLQSPAIQKYIKDKKVEVHAAYYNLQTGAVELLTE